MALTYAVASSAKVRLGITDTNDDDLLVNFCSQVNGWIESKTGRPIGPDTTSTYTLDGYDALEDGRLLLFPRGIVSVSTLEVTTNTGAAFTTVPASDYFLRPTSNEREPGWPATELWMTDIPSASNTAPYFFPGFGTIRITGVFGWAAIPQDLIDVALTLVVASYRARGAGGGDSITIGVDGERTFERALSYKDRMTIERYRSRRVYVV